MPYSKACWEWLDHSEVQPGKIPGIIEFLYPFVLLQLSLYPRTEQGTVEAFCVLSERTYHFPHFLKQFTGEGAKLTAIQKVASLAKTVCLQKFQTDLKL